MYLTGDRSTLVLFQRLHISVEVPQFPFRVAELFQGLSVFGNIGRQNEEPVDIPLFVDVRDIGDLDMAFPLFPKIYLLLEFDLLTR